MKNNYLKRKQIYELNKVATELWKANRKHSYYFHLSNEKDKEIQKLLDEVLKQFIAEGVESGHYTIGACSFSYSWHKETIEILDIEEIGCAE